MNFMKIVFTSDVTGSGIENHNIVNWCGIFTQ